MDKKTLEKLKKIKKDDSFLMTITVFNKRKRTNKKLDTFLILNKFPYSELKETKKTVIELIDGTKKK